jgi:phosphoribosyl-AMP cyclohydrolase
MLKFDDKGLIPVIVQDAADGTVLMVGYASKESLKLTLERGEMVFWSRSRKELWHKGETSGNVLKVKSIYKDCDSDALLVKAEPAGPTCHTGKRSCFFTDFSKKDLE